MDRDTINENWIMEDERIWYDIPGFPRYEISERFEVRIKKTGNIMKAKRVYNTFRVQLAEGGKKSYDASVIRILYAAMHGIDPRKIGKGFRFVCEGGILDARHIVIHEEKEADPLRAYDEKRPDITRVFYEKSYRIGRIVKERDVDGLYAFINEDKEEVMRIIASKIRDKSRITETYDRYVNYLIDGILSYRVKVVDLVGYTRKLFGRARYLERVDFERERKRREVRFSERVESRHGYDPGTDGYGP